MLGSFLFVLTFSFAAFSETELLLSPDEKLWLAQHPELRLGVIASRLPFEALSSERKQEGIASDYANWLEKTLGIRFVAHPVPDTGLHLPFGEGKLDVHLSAVDTLESRKTMLFTRPYLELPLVLFMMNDAPFVNGLQDMKGKRVAAVGERLLDILKDTSPEIRAVEARTTREALEMLERRQVDAVFEILDAGTHVIRLNNIPQVIVAAVTPYRLPIRIGVRKDWPQLAAILDKALGGIPPTASQDFHNRWFNVQRSAEIAWSLFWEMTATVILIALGIVLTALFMLRKVRKEVLVRRNTEAMLNSLLENLPAAVCLFDSSCRCRKLNGAHIHFDFPTVGGTENRLMAAALADGETILENAAREPEVVDLARFLIACGARIEGHGTSVIRIQGVPRLGGCTYRIMPDRIEAGTLLAAAGITDGELLLTDCPFEELDAVIAKMRQMGMEIEPTADGVLARRSCALRGVDVTTQPFPGFPTDMQAQIMSLMCLSEGSGVISETIFENRFMHVQELVRMGADIRLSGHTAIIRGVQRLAGAPVMASDLRASASLVLAGLAAKGTTTVQRIYHLDRGYEHIENKLNAVGARIRREAE